MNNHKNKVYALFAWETIVGALMEYKRHGFILCAHPNIILWLGNAWSCSTKKRMIIMVPSMQKVDVTSKPSTLSKFYCFANSCSCELLQSQWSCTRLYHHLMLEKEYKLKNGSLCPYCIWSQSIVLHLYVLLKKTNMIDWEVIQEIYWMVVL